MELDCALCRATELEVACHMPAAKLIVTGMPVLFRGFDSDAVPCFTVNFHRPSRRNFRAAFG